NDQALNLLDLCSRDYKNISIHYMDTNLETMKEVISNTDLSVVRLNVQYLEGSQVCNIIGQDPIDLMLTASTEQYRRAIQTFTGKVTMNTDSAQQRLSPVDAVKYLENEANHVKSITFQSIDKETANKIVSSVEQVAFAVIFNQLSVVRMGEIIEMVR